MKINKVHCLFEQSGTFKNAFKALGIDAEDYDVNNDFGQTDHQIDIFNEINNAYINRPSIFDNIAKDDLIMAFFPCTRFECKIPLNFRGEASQQKNWNDDQKLEYSMQLHEELHMLYMLISKLFLICLRGGKGLLLRIHIHNPII